MTVKTVLCAKDIIKRVEDNPDKRGNFLQITHLIGYLYPEYLKLIQLNIKR